MTFSGTTDFSTSANAINDGSFGTAWNTTGTGSTQFGPNEGGVVTFTLNTNASPLGYDIAHIVSIASYGDGLRSRQKYDVALHYVSDPPGAFTAVAIVNNLGYNTGAAEWTRVDVPTYATGVDQVRLTFHKNNLAGVTIYREVDIFGQATRAPKTGTNQAPPPASIAPSLFYSLSAPAADPTSATDLLDASQTTRYSTVLNGNVTYGDLSAVHDGTFGPAWDDGGTSYKTVFGPSNGAQVVFLLDTAASRCGYSITSIVTTASYTDGRRTVQKYDVAAHYVNTPSNLVALSSVNNLGSNSGAAEWTRVTIADGGSVIAEGVDQLRFTFHDNGIPSGGVVIYRGIDVFGFPTPPPSGTAIVIR
ncbi:MAG: hypothetical protein PHR35_04855 [Kiritimatiellae bacterium]|nr:hypothetical protein [Kiritimatiellia bacterium]